MTNNWVTLLPMPLDEAIHLLEGDGCTVVKLDDDKVVGTDGKGNYARLTIDIDGYTTLSVVLCPDTIMDASAPSPADADDEPPLPFMNELDAVAPSTIKNSKQN